MKDLDALGYLIRFAKRRKGRAFSPEEVTLGVAEKGIAFTDNRAWGNVFAIAAREGYIRRSEQLFSRDIQATAKLVRMRSMAADVESVLREFFVPTEAGWRGV